MLAVNFVFILYYGNNVRQNANLSGFLFQVQNGLKTLKVMNNISSQTRTAREHTVQYWFYKGDQNLDDDRPKVSYQMLKTII